MPKVVFSSDQLPQGLTDRQHFVAWRDLYNDQIGRGDIAPAEAPFRAHLEFVLTRQVMLGRAAATLAHSEHGGRRASSNDEGRVGLVTNTTAGTLQVNQRGREALLAPGQSILLSRVDNGRFDFPKDPGTSSWLVVDLPEESLLRLAPGAQDLIGVPLVSGSEALRMVAGYAGMIFQQGGFSDPLLDAHASQTLIDLVGLAVGAEKDATAIARERGLRAARLEAIMREIATGFADPSFSVAAVAKKLRLSERYVQNLLHETGASFSDRVLELRLQHAVTLLARPGSSGRKVIDIAMACGFNDLSYFHRCFRRRFGMTPAGAREA